MEILDLVHGDDRKFLKRFPCDEPGCTKGFNRNSDLLRHQRIHNNERPYVCSWRGCSKSFIQRSALTVHRRVHTGERPHKCTEEGCHRAFGDSSSLARHRRVHTGARPYQCEHPRCRKTFCRKITLTKHIKRHHAYNYPTSGSNGNGCSTPLSSFTTPGDDETPSSIGSSGDLDEEEEEDRKPALTSPVLCASTPSAVGLGIDLKDDPPKPIYLLNEPSLSAPSPYFRSSSVDSARSELSDHSAMPPPAIGEFNTWSPSMAMDTPPLSDSSPSTSSVSSMSSIGSMRESRCTLSPEPRPTWGLPPLRLSSSNMDVFVAPPVRDKRSPSEPTFAPRITDLGRFDAPYSSPMAGFELPVPSPTWPNYFSLGLASPHSPRHYQPRTPSFSKDFWAPMATPSACASLEYEARRNSVIGPPMPPQRIREQYEMIERSL